MATDFSELLRTYRTSMGWSQAELSEKWSYSFETISAWERRKRTPSSQEIPRLAKFLEMEPEQLKETIINSREKSSRTAGKSTASNQTKATWKSSFETWGEFQGLYKTRTEFNKEFSYPRMFENAQSILATGISLNAIAMNYDREEIIKAITERNCTIKMCFLDPYGEKCTEREDEEGYRRGILTVLTETNIHMMKILRERIEKTFPEYNQQLEIRVYDMIPRFNIYIVDDTLMTVQHYAYGRGEETPTMVLEKKANGGIFDFYASAAKRILENSKDINKSILEDKRGQHERDNGQHITNT